MLLSSHIFVEVENLTDRLSIIRDGKNVESGPLSRLQGQARTSIHAAFERVPTPADLSSLRDVHIDGNRLTATADASKVGDAMTLLAPYGLAASSATVALLTTGIVGFRRWDTAG